MCRLINGVHGVPARNLRAKLSVHLISNLAGLYASATGLESIGCCFHGGCARRLITPSRCIKDPGGFGGAMKDGTEACRGQFEHDNPVPLIGETLDETPGRGARETRQARRMRKTHIRILGIVVGDKSRKIT